ncbi:MAG: sulfotransferase [Acidobacteriota bacterium]|nr:sulfotransferase [Acidobacteriota bacterium]
MRNLPLSRLAAGPIFIVGAARSGTTWVYDIFNAHPKVAGVFESWLFTPKDGLGSLFTEAHWPPKFSGLGRLLRREELVRHAREFAETILGHAVGDEHRYLVEKSPSHLFHIPFIGEIFPASRFIHVVRDGRDVAVSVLDAAASWVPIWKSSFGRSIASSAKAWGDAVRRAQRYGRELGPDRFLEIRYETLRNDPLSQFREMFDFCGIPYDDALLKIIEDKTDFSKNYRGGAGKFRRGGRAGDWKTTFSRKDALVFQAVAGTLLIELGYEHSMDWVRTSPRKRGVAK